MRNAMNRSQRLHRQLSVAPGMAQRGLSLVELLVGVTIGLFITAAAAMLVSSQLVNNRQLLSETQIQQDLRATADIIARDLRRASYAANAETFAASFSSGAPPVESWARQIRIVPSVGGVDSTDVNYRYARGPSQSQFELRLNSTDQVIQRCIGTAPCQPLTDGNVLKVTRFKVEELPSAPGVPLEVSLACTNLCLPGNDESCWPRIKLRELAITIDGRSADGRVVRSVSTSVRVRNDTVEFAAGATQVCP